MASIYSKQYKCNRRGVQFRRPFDFSATPRQECLKMQGCKAKLQPCGENSIFAASMCLYQRRRTSVKRAKSRDNEEIRDVIDTIAKKAVLILGRFTPERKSILEAIRAVLRAKGYLPILFDFQKPDSQDLTGTVSTLANISRFIIADLTDPSCSPYEIGLIAPYMKPIKPLFQPSKAARHEFAMFQDLRKRYSWVLPIYRYKDHESLLASLQEKVIAPAEQRVQMLEKKKRR